MDRNTAVEAIFGHFAAAPDRYAAHLGAQPLLQQLSRDRQFLHDCVRRALLEGHLQHANVLTIPVADDGDVSVDINLFAPSRDGRVDVAADYIHHHGWRLLSSSVIHGGYDAIMFERRSHREREGEAVALRILEPYRHTGEAVRFVDSETCHVVFRPAALSATLAVWSADRRRAATVVKRALSPMPALRRAAARSARALQLSFRPVGGAHFLPLDGKIKAIQHDGGFDVDRHELVACSLRFFQIIGFEDSALMSRLKEGLSAEAGALIDRFIAGEPIAESGVAGHPRRYFTKDCVLRALPA